MKIVLAIAIIPAVFCAWGPDPLTAAPRSPVAQEEIGERPQSTPPNTPTTVAIDLWGVQLLDIDPVNQTYEVEAHLTAMWTDSRLARASMTLYQDAAAEDILKTIWWPYFEIENSRGPRSTIHRTVRIDADGRIHYQERFTATIKQHLALYSFPFDDTDISFSVIPFSARSDEVRFTRLDSADATPRRMTDVRPDLPMEWAVRTPELSVDSSWPRATVRMWAIRMSDSYEFNIILPLALIVLVSSAVFWMDHSTTHLGDRLSVSFTALLTVVAFDFVTSEGLPKLFYLTTMDKILIGTYVTMTLAMVQNVWACVLHTRSHPKAALLVDRASRVLFPVGYLVLLRILIRSA